MLNFELLEEKLIVANIATYPPRVSQIERILSSVSPQVDRVNVVLNQMDTVPDILSGFDNVVPILPEKDTKDTGKFYPNVKEANWVFLLDDDIIYPVDYIVRTIREVEKLGRGRWICGYHASVYHPLPFRRNKFHLKRWLKYRLLQDLASERKVFHFKKGLEAPLIVDQIGTGTAVMNGRDVPTFGYVEGAQMFVDVRLAAWCFEQSITPVSLPRPKDWLTPIQFEATIYNNFTLRTNWHVNAEIRRFAGRVRGRGQNPLLYKPSCEKHPGSGRSI